MKTLSESKIRMFNLFLIAIFFVIVIGVSFFKKMRINRQMKAVASERMINIEVIKKQQGILKIILQENKSQA